MIQSAEKSSRLEKWYGRDGENVKYLQELVIYSRHVQKALREVIKIYHGVNLAAIPIILYGTPKCVFHYRKELAEYHDRVKDTAAKMHLRLLFRYMNQELRSSIRLYEANVESSPKTPVSLLQPSQSDFWLPPNACPAVSLQPDMKERTSIFTGVIHLVLNLFQISPSTSECTLHVERFNISMRQDHRLP